MRLTHAIPIIAIVACGNAQNGSSTITGPTNAPRHSHIETGKTIEDRFPAPAESERSPSDPGSFAAYLRSLALKPPGTNVELYNGDPKSRQDVHAAVIDISVGDKDLQQCADAIMRLHAEYLYQSGKQGQISFNFTNGFVARWDRWSQGDRVRVAENKCTWVKTGQRDASHEQLQKYLEHVFLYAGTLSLSKELKSCAEEPMHIGDVFIKGGSPGHAVIVVDVARNADGQTYFMLAQSYMPAQNIHVLLNHSDPALGAWFLHNADDQLHTPEWTFEWGDRKRW